MSMKDLVCLEAFQYFLEEIKDRRDMELNTLLGAKEVTEIYRAQGAIQALDAILDLTHTAVLQTD